MSDGNIRRFTAANLRAMRARGEDLTDWAAVSAKTEAELEADIASDPDFRDIPKHWFEKATAANEQAQLI